MLLLSSSSSRSSRDTGAISPSPSAALSASAPDRKVGQKEEGGAETAISLCELMKRHIAAQLATADAVRAWDEPRAASKVTNVAYANRLLDVARDEEACRLAIINYRPRGDREFEAEAGLYGSLPHRDTWHPATQSDECRLGRHSRSAKHIGFLSLLYAGLHNGVLRPHCCRLCRGGVPYRPLRRTRVVTHCGVTSSVNATRA